MPSLNESPMGIVHSTNVTVLVTNRPPLIAQAVAIRGAM